MLGEDAGEADVESVVKEDPYIPKLTAKITDSSLNDSDKLKRPKKKRKKYEYRIITTTFLCTLSMLYWHS